VGLHLERSVLQHQPQHLLPGDEHLARVGRGQRLHRAIDRCAQGQAFQPSLGAGRLLPLLVSGAAGVGKLALVVGQEGAELALALGAQGLDRRLGLQLAPGVAGQLGAGLERALLGVDQVQLAAVALAGQHRVTT
jgi:hypothetical protein